MWTGMWQGEHMLVVNHPMWGTHACNIRVSYRVPTPAWLRRCGTRPADTMLAFGVDQRVLGAAKMSRRLLEEAASDCGGVVLQGFADIRAALQLFAEPYAQQQACAQRFPRRSPPRLGGKGPQAAAAEPPAACAEEGAGEKGGARCPRRSLEDGAMYAVITQPLVRMHVLVCTWSW